MTTRMQQRRGTAAQWTAGNPVLASGEIGFETDTTKFKIGNGTTAWNSLVHYASATELAALVDGAPAMLNTLKELSEAIGNDPDFFTTISSDFANAINEHNSDTTGVHGIANTGLLATLANVATATEEAINAAGTDSDAKVLTHANDTSNVHGIIDTSLLATGSSVADAISDHNLDTTNVHGIINTANLALISDVTDHNSDLTNVHGIADTSELATKTYANTAVSTHQADTTDVHGITNTANLATKTYADTAVSTHQADTTDVHGISNTGNLVYITDLSTHNSDTTDVHGITNTANLIYSADLTDHNADSLNVHGIADTSLLATHDYVSTAIGNAATDMSLLAGTGIDWNATSEQFDIDSTVATKTYADAAVSTHNTATLNVHGIANTALLALKSEVAAVTATTLGLGNVTNTADANKPVSTAQASAIATAKSEAIADATAQVNALLAGAPAALNTLDELAAALGDDANYASTVTTSLGLKVDSLTPISQKTASYTLSSLTERDDLIEMGSSSALTLTIPPASAVDYPIGTSIDILQTGAGQVTIAAGSGVTVNATPGLKLRTTWSSATLFKRAANTWVVFGDLTA
jgi:hypothetical protein